MMYPNDLSWSFIALHLHMIFVSTAIVGAILFLYWAMKHMDKKHLTTWITWLLIVGIVGTLLTAGLGARAFSWIFQATNPMGMNPAMMQMMMGAGNEEFQTSEQWQQHMQEEMQQYMGL